MQKVPLDFSVFIKIEGEKVLCWFEREKQKNKDIL